MPRQYIATLTYIDSRQLTTSSTTACAVPYINHQRHNIDQPPECIGAEVGRPGTFALAISGSFVALRMLDSTAAHPRKG